jgi:glycosyltransferase involved in cell wall biosynthesis
VVLDDRSTDRTVEVVAAWGERHSEFPLLIERSTERRSRG